jgi:thiol-disulfide isomerase/thioredoxin
MKKLGIGNWGLAATMLILSTTLPRIAYAQDDEVGIAIGKVPPAAVIEDLDGRLVDLSRYVGHGPVLVEFWATWCPICRALLPRMAAAHDRYGRQVTFLVVGVAVNETQASIKRHVAEHPMPFPVLWDTNGNATRAFDAPATSYVVILNAKGAVAYTGTGSDQDLDGALAKALQP